MNYPELPARYADQVENDAELRFLYCSLEGRGKPIQIFREAREMLRRGFNVDLNLDQEEIKYAHYRFRDGERSKKPVYFVNPNK